MAELAASLTATEAERLDQAEALVRGFCGWHIAPWREDTVEVRSHGGTILMLPSLYVTDVGAISDDETALTIEDDYTWSSAGVLTRIGYWGDGTVVEVTFSHGYDDPPPEVTAVVQAVAQRAVDNPGSLVRTQDGPFSDTFSTTSSGQVATLSLLDAEKEVLRRYRIPGIA